MKNKEIREEQALAQKKKGSIVSVIDENGNGEIDIEDIIIKGLKTPGIRINRDDFLRKQLLKKYPQEIIDSAVSESPMKAKISKQEIDKMAKEAIKFERNCVSGISTALSVPGGLAMVATIPADIIQYYGYLLRATQKLMYLYGFPQISTEENSGKFDDETLNCLIICFGVMYGVVGANNALKSIAKALGSGVERELLKKALTKGSLYPFVKKVAKYFSVHLTREVFAGFFKKAIPFVSGLIGGGITYISFKPCCEKLRKSLQNTILSNPNYQPNLEEEIPINSEEQDEKEH